MRFFSGLNPRRLIPCLSMPVLCAAVYLVLSRTGLYAKAYILLFGWDEVGPGLDFLCFPALALLTGLLPAVLLTGRERNVWTGWSAVFFAGFFAFEVMNALGWDIDIPFFLFLWIPAVLLSVFFHFLPSWIASAVRGLSERMRRKRCAS